MENIETLLAAVAQTTGFGDDEPVASTPSELELEKPGSPDVARDDENSGEARPAAGIFADLAAAVPVPERVIDGGKKRKRGRPPKGHVPVKPPPVKRVKVEEEEEDVCFICFDGGSLVLCDRKGCPKAYHPACIKRDEAFFKSKAKWNCGWHICSVCRKPSHYFCYTCTYSLCKGCTRNTDYLCVRGNKGFCSTCMKTIMLIENKDQATNESIKVDFDDKLSWEYLFKMYWVLLKESLSLTLSELTQAKRPWKGEGAVTRKPRLSNVLPSAVGEVSMSYISRGQLELNRPDAECKLVHNDGSMTSLSIKGSHVEKLNSNSGDHGPRCGKETVNANTDKVTNETSIDKASAKPATTTKEFIHDSCIGKDLNDPSIVKDTTKTCSKEFIHDSCIGKDLNDPSIVKDTTKTCTHKNTSTVESHKQVNITDKLVVSVANGNIPTPINSRKRKTRKKSEDRVAQLDLNEYAAIDVHNINLIYLRRNLVERLLENRENFNDKVTGCIVRIKISADDQKPEVHRLVQVIGTCQVTEPYKIGNSTADVMLEVLNLDRKEVVSIVAISNEEFTEDECKWLRQSIRCGLVKQFTVYEVKEKAMALQPVRVDDWLEAEILRLNHLRDPAGTKGTKKVKYVDRLQLLKSPKERQRRISEVPSIHSDPTMSPNYESEEDTKSGGQNIKDQHVGPSYSPYPQNDWEILSNEKGKEERSAEAQPIITEKTDASGSSDFDTHTHEIDIDSSPADGRKEEAIPRIGLGTLIAIPSNGNSRPADNIETEKLWHYRDSNSKIQGPFSMMQLRICSTTGLFPPDMRIWTNHEQYDSLLLTDALNGKFHGAPDLSHEAASSSPQENGLTGGIVVSEGTNGTGKDNNKPTEVAGCDSLDVFSDRGAGPVKADELCSSGWPQCWDLLKDSNPSAEDVQVCNLPSSNSEKRDEALTDGCRESDEIKNSSQNGENSLIGPTQNSMSSGNELQNHPNKEGRAGQYSEGNLKPLNIDLSSNDLESVPVFAPISKAPSSSKLTENIDVLDLLSPALKTENQQSVSADIPVQGSGYLELLSPAPRSSNEDQGPQETDTKQSAFINLPTPNSGSGLIGASTLGIGGVQLPDVADEWCAYPHTAARPSIPEWDSGLVSSRPHEVAGENSNIPAPDGQSLTHVPSSHPTSNGTNWLAIMNEPIEFVALGEDSVSDLLAEVDAMESQGVLPSPTSAMKFARELLEDCKDDCFADFSPTPEPRKSDAFSSTSDVNLNSQSSAPCKPNGTSPVDAFDFFRRSSGNSSASSEGETSAAVHSGDAGSEFHPPAPNQEIVGTTMAPVPGSDATEPSWGQMQGNINLVTVQGNVNLVLGGPTQGMTNLGWGTNPGVGWANPNPIRSPRNGSLPWDGQRKYGGERFNCPRDRGYQGNESGFGRGRPPWGRQPYSSGGGYSRPLPKGQRVCKFYESGHCKKGAFCDYLHP